MSIVAMIIVADKLYEAINRLSLIVEWKKRLLQSWNFIEKHNKEFINTINCLLLFNLFNWFIFYVLQNYDDATVQWQIGCFAGNSCCLLLLKMYFYWKHGWFVFNASVFLYTYMTDIMIFLLILFVLLIGKKYLQNICKKYDYVVTFITYNNNFFIGKQKKIRHVKTIHL